MTSLTRAPARSASPVWTLLACSAAVFMCVLDALVVTTALPVLRTSLHSGVSGLEWTVNAYNLTFACLLLTGAALGDRFGRRRILCTGLAVFALASAAAALSPAIGILIAARAVQGAGAALVMSLTLTLVSSAFPTQKRGLAIGIWAAAGGLSGAIGPFAGGVIVQAVGWHWIFWINVPVGLALIPLTARKVHESFGDRPRLDVAGLVLASAGLLGILWGLIRASTAGWGSGEVIGTLTAGAVITAGFLLWEHRAAHPMLPLAMFRQPRFAAANGVGFCLFAGLFGALFLTSQYFQTALQLTPAQAGARLLAWSAPGLVIMPFTGKLAGRYGNRPLMLAGLLGQAAGLAAVAVLAAHHASYAPLAIALVTAGAGSSMAYPAIASEVVSSVPAAQIGIASGANSALRELGGVFGVAILATVFTRPAVYTSTPAFTAGFSAALWAGAALTATGILLALAVRTRPAAAPAQLAPSHASTPEPALSAR
jgi:EmrB/QacA subfamily drug resistance transporter